MSYFAIYQEPPVAKLLIYVQPGAKTTGIVGLHDGRLKLRIQAKAQDGKANAAVIAYFAKALGINRSELEILSGQKNRYKTLLWHTTSTSAISARLTSLLPDNSSKAVTHPRAEPRGDLAHRASAIKASGVFW